MKLIILFCGMLLLGQVNRLMAQISNVSEIAPLEGIVTSKSKSDVFLLSSPAEAATQKGHFATSEISSARTNTESSAASYVASNAKPKYPMIAKRNNEQGLVVLRVLVKQDGSAGRVEVKSSSGFERLDRAAVEAVETWHFNPATHDGKPVDDWSEVIIPFKIQK